MNIVSAAVFVVVIAAVVGCDVYATRLCLLHEAHPRRRFAQLALTWLVPFVGAALVALAHRPSTSKRDPALDYTSSVDAAGVTALFSDSARHD